MRYMRFLVCSAGVALLVACNSLVGNDPPKLRTAVVADQDAAPPPPQGIQCAGDEKKCVGTCVSKFSSGFSCASETSCDPCPQYAHATPMCNGPVCGAECKKGYENCDTTSPDCETDLASAKTCGACNGNCGSDYCSPDGTGSFLCTGSCQGGLQGCESNGDKKCVNLQDSVTNCGECNHACPEPDHGTATCQGGQCGFTCDPGFNACGGQCVSVTDTTACGEQCLPCGKPGPQQVVVCNRGACETVCEPGWADCNGKPDDGCEIYLMNDNANCGVCFRQCTGGIITPPIQTANFGGGTTDPNSTCCFNGGCSYCAVTQ